ncbi:MAG: ATP-binding cassette domain-containing protein [Candidatus Cloacimonetes bacterium]|nr:ATP-binding cassette domain-containing protein [Candidatus Cloacimonadota bacterium]
MSVIEVKHVNKNFGDLKAVQDISFNIDEGSVFGFLGPNGAGKTTTIRMIMNIIIPDSGEIRVMGEKDMRVINNQIGYLPEERGIYRKMILNEVLLFLAELKMMKLKAAQQAVDYWLERFNLMDWKKKKVEELSKGMQQKLQFIATIMFDPSLIILDEPFLGLDPINVNLIKNTIVDLKKQGKTIIFSTHSMESAERLCDEIFLINKGRKVLSGQLSKVKESFGKRNIQLQYEGTHHFLEASTLIDRYDDFGKYTEVQLRPDVDPQDFLKEIIPQVQIRRFEIMEPSLNDIFIESVTEKKEMNSA